MEFWSLTNPFLDLNYLTYKKLEVDLSCQNGQLYVISHPNKQVNPNRIPFDELASRLSDSAVLYDLKNQTYSKYNRIISGNANHKLMLYHPVPHMVYKFYHESERDLCLHIEAGLKHECESFCFAKHCFKSGNKFVQCSAGEMTRIDDVVRQYEIIAYIWKYDPVKKRVFISKENSNV